VGGAIAGVLVGDYHLLRHKRLPAAALYPTRGQGGGIGGCVNAAAVLALLAAFLPFAFRAAVLRALGDGW
jgi:cytosine/uracil/thiamine/allantoin permease